MKELVELYCSVDDFWKEFKNEWDKQKLQLASPFANHDSNNIADIFRGNDDHFGSTNSLALNRLQKRVKALEELNDQLYARLSFILENLPDLISKTLHSEAEKLRHQHQDNVPCATRRENDVLELLGQGYGAKEIAEKLFISETTVITHKKNLKKKFNVKNTVELISKIGTYRNV